MRKRRDQMSCENGVDMLIKMNDKARLFCVDKVSYSGYLFTFKYSFNYLNNTFLSTFSVSLF